MLENRVPIPKVSKVTDTVLTDFDRIWMPAFDLLSNVCVCNFLSDLFFQNNK